MGPLNASLAAIRRTSAIVPLLLTLIAPGAQGTPAPTQINSVVSDVDRTSLFITGDNFCTSPVPEVVIFLPPGPGLTPLPVRFSSATQIVVDYPVGAPGIYVFAVKCGSKNQDYTWSSIVIGADSGVTLGANTFTGTQTAPAFVGDGSGLTNLPVPAGVATLGANVFTGTQIAPAFVGNGSGLTNLPVPAGVATLGANVFTGTQKIGTGNLDLDASTGTTGNITKTGSRFLHNTGFENTFLGIYAGISTTTGSSNTGIGQYALGGDTSGSNNTATGSNALVNNVTGSYNTASGVESLLNNTAGNNNTAHGAYALRGNTTAWNNTAVGVEVLRKNTTGQNNTGTGAFAFDENTIGGANTATGAFALEHNTIANGNTANGAFALFANTFGSENTALGRMAGYNATTGANNIYLGANVVGVAGESNTMYLGLQGTQTKSVIAGVRGITTGVADAVPVVIDSTGQLGTVSSSRRFKEDIRDMGDASRALFDLRPVTFRYAQAYVNGAKPIQYGLIAEEVAEAFPPLAVYNADGTVDTVHYETLSVLLLNEVRKQQTEIEAQRQRIEALESRINKLVEGGAASPR